MSYGYEVHERGTAPDKYIRNAMRFATIEEATAFGFSFGMVAFFFDDGRTFESTDAVNCVWNADEGAAFPLTKV